MGEKQSRASLKDEGFCENYTADGSTTNENKRDRKPDQKFLQKQETSILGCFKRDRSGQQSRKYFDFGEPCHECRSKKAARYKSMNAELRCFICFYIKYLDDKFSEDNDCNLNGTLRKRIFEISETFGRSICNKKEHESFINIKGFFCDQIHNAVVETTISKNWHKAHSPQQYDKTKIKRKEENIQQDNLSDNYMKVEILTGDDKDDCNKQTVYVHLEDGIEKKIGLYEKGGTDLERKLIQSLNKELAAIPAQSTVVKDALGYLAKCDDYLIVVCLHQSRMKEDIHYTLENIQEKDYRRVIVVFLHYKQCDKDYQAKDFQDKKCYSDLSFIDYFVHQEKENMREVIDTIKDVVFRYT